MIVGTGPADPCSTQTVLPGGPAIVFAIDRSFSGARCRWYLKPI